MERKMVEEAWERNVREVMGEEFYAHGVIKLAAAYRSNPAALVDATPTDVAQRVCDDMDALVVEVARRRGRKKS